MGLSSNDFLSCDCSVYGETNDTSKQTVNEALHTSDSQEGFLTGWHFSFLFISALLCDCGKTKVTILKKELCMVGELCLKLHLFLLLNCKSAQLQWKYSKSAFPVFLLIRSIILLNTYCVREFLFFSEIIFGFCKNMDKPNKFSLTVMKGFEVTLQ